MKSPHLLSFCSLVLFSYGVFAEALVAKNPPSKCKQGDPECTCETQQQVANSCIKVNLDLGATTPWTGSQRCSLKVFADAQSPLVFTPESLYAVMGYTFKRIGNTLAADGITPKEVVFTHPNGEPVYFVFNDGESIARPDPGFHIKMDERLQMVDAEGWACTRNPVYYDLYETDGTVRRFVATDASNERGRLVSIMDCRGKVTTPADLGIDIVYGPDGVRQFLTPSRLADIAVRQDGYDVTVYPLASLPAKNSVNGRYVLPQGAPLETLSVRSANDGKRAVVTLRKGGGDSETYLFDYVRDDWSLTRPSGVEERHSRFIQDAEAARTVEETYSGAAELLSRDEYNYVWQSWGFAATNRVEGFGGIARTTTWEYYTSGNGKGQVRTEIRPTGLKTEYVYDASDRMITRRRSGPDMMTEVTTYSYVSVDASDVVPPVDSRPRTVVKKLNGIECERTYYVYSPLTNIVERVGTQGAAYGGTNALRTVTGFYPVVPDDIRSGMVCSIRREDGKVDVYDYTLVTNVWTEIVTHLHEQAMSPVSGKTTRDTRITNVRGEVVEERSEAFIDGTWYVISRNCMTYNLQGKHIQVKNLAGQVTMTAWDCCHKISETQPDGQTTTWDYDAEGRMIASSRLIPLDMTNVTWVTICYRYDGLGRQIATWTTNYTAHIGIPATTTSYDALGRVIARTDVLGNATTMTYSPDGRTVSVRKPNGATVITTRNSDGDTLSITGTGVTPEFYTYGVLPDGTRWAKTVQGETADSPRFTKSYENLLGETIRSEKSGFRGAVLSSVNTYDNYGRIVSTASDGEPTNEITYDTLGNRVATTTRIASGEWRKSEFPSSYVKHESNVWAVQTNITLCSDSAVVPLVQSHKIRLTGLTVNKPWQMFSRDIRGNLTESCTVYSNGILTAKRRVPDATNVVISLSRFGIVLESVSLSAVTNTTIYDALGRVGGSVDGRGNMTHFEYDSFGRRSLIVDAIGSPTHYAYDRFGSLVAITNALGNAVIYSYDLRGHKTYEGGATYPVSYAYDVFGNKVSMMTYRDELNGRARTPAAPQGDVTIWFYDEASNCMTNKVYADGNGTKYDYDAHGRLTRRTWARGIDTFYAYDGWGNLTNTTYSDDTPTIAIKYDVLGRQIEVHDAAGITCFAYDVFGVNTNETVVGVAGTNIIERFTDAFGRDIGYALNGERRSVINRDCATGRIETMLAGACTNAFVWTYYPGSDLKHTLRYPNGLLVTWEYEPHRDLITLVSNDVLSTYRYTYDEVGRRVSKNDERYAYNVRGEIILATNIVSGAEFVYSYDDMGNRLWSREFGTNCIYVANELNQYTNIVRGGVCEHSAFDLDGGQTNIVTTTGEWEVSYNGENRPVRWCRVTDGAEICMSYDRLGRRVLKNDEKFVYDGYLNVNETIWDPTDLLVTRPLASLKVDGEFGYYFLDANKNVVGVVSADKVVAKYEYSVFGTFLMSAGAMKASSCLFSSEYMDVENEMVHYNFRELSPKIGRWCTRDPGNELSFMALHSSVSSRQFREYCFVDNNPVSFVDRVGLDCPGCDVVGVLPIFNTSSALKCCAKHDECYSQYGCSALTSWPIMLGKIAFCQAFGIPPFLCTPLLIPFTRCDECNIEVVACLMGAAAGIKPTGPDYYCPKGKRYIRIGGEFGDYKDKKEADKCCCTE